MSLHVNVEFFAGTDISTGSSELIALANKLGCTVMADFNGVSLMGCPGDDPLSLENKYHFELNGKKSYKLARADRPASEKCGAVDNSTQQTHAG